ncbi:tetratricopeptide-like helical domain-containing protein, partial [Tanacetum coccineum]
SKQDLQGAEEYYSRAILVDPNDGEILSQYAKLLWELHQDKDRAMSYFERAVQAASEDSHVHAAYASFLWDFEGDEDEEEGYYSNIPPLFNNGTMASAATA